MSALSGVEVTKNTTKLVNIVVASASRLVIYNDDSPAIIDADDLPEESEAKFREIERCDGKRAMVLMTDWYDP